MESRAAAIVPEIVPKELWEQEYDLKRCIPSSTREDPAKSLVLFSELLNLREPVKVLDAGCGNGRNAIYLAKRGCEVVAVDFCEAALQETQTRVARSGVGQKVKVLKYLLDDPAPFSDESFDFVLDAYTSCHFLRQEAVRRFWADMARVTRPSGHLLSIAFSTEDSYYAQFLRDSPDGHLVCDPTNLISKRLYTEHEVKAFLSQNFEVRYFARFEFDDVVRGKSYRRVLLISVLRKLSK